MTIFPTYKTLLIRSITALCLLLLVWLLLFCGFLLASPCKNEKPYQQNQMVDGCVMQKSGGTWIRTCG